MARGKPRSAFTDPGILQNLENVTQLIEGIMIILAGAVEQGVFKRYRGANNIWIFDDPRALNIATKMSTMRNDIIDALNKTFEDHGLSILPLITDELDSHGYMGKSNHQFRADADHFE